MKTKSKFLLTGVIATITIVSTLILTHLVDFSIAKGSPEHNDHCNWNHYERVEPTYNNNGIQEYYVCCDHHESVLERPTTGNITDKGMPTQSFIDSLEETDFRLIPSYRKQVEPIQSLIDKISYHYSITDGSLIDKAYREYNAMSDALKSYVQNVDKLNEIHEIYHENYEILIDTTLNEYQCQIYNSTYDLECLYDDEYGYYSEFSNITMQQDCWFGMGRNDGTSIAAYREIFFYAYNNSSNTRTIDIRDKYEFDLYSSHITLPSHQWTKISIPLSVFVTRKLDDMFIGSYISGMTGILVEQGFKYTSLYGVIGRVAHNTYMDLNDDSQIQENVDFTGKDVPMEEIDYAAHIISTSYSEFTGKVNFITANTYSNVTQVSFDAKIDGTATGWWGIGHSSSVETARIYTGMVTTGITTTNNEFQHVTLSVNITGPEYIYIIVEKNTFVKDLFIDNFTIKCGSVDHTDSFDECTSTLFNTDTSVLNGAVSFEPLNKVDYYMTQNVADYCVEVNSATYGGSAASYKSTFITSNTYTDVTSISFDAKVSGTMTALDGGEQIWWGFGVGEDDGIYSTEFTRQVLTTNDEWVHYNYSHSEVSGYVKFVINPNKTSCNIFIDNIVITTLTGSYVESFGVGGGSLFDVGSHCSIRKRSASTITFNGGTMTGGNHSILMDIYTYGNRSGNAATLMSKNAYTNLTSISFDVKIDGTITYTNTDDYWFGVGHYSSNNASIYKNIQTRKLLTTNNTWMHVDFSFTNVTNEYVFFVSNPVHAHNNLYIDNIVIVANGNTYTDNLENGSALFNLGQDVSIAMDSMDYESIDVYSILTNPVACFEGPDFIRDNLDGQESLIYGTIGHDIVGDGQYAIVIYNDAENVEYLLVNSSSVKLYSNHTLINSQNIVSQTYDIAITNNGKVSINGHYMGKTTEVNDSIKFVSMFGQGTVVFTQIFLITSVYVNNSKETIDGIEVPNFSEEDNVVFAAYASPTVANWDGASNNPSMITDEDFQDYVDAGFSKCIPLYEGRTGARYNFNTVYDLYLEVTDPTQKEQLRQQLLNLIDQMCDKANEDAMAALALAQKYHIKYVVLNTIVFELIHHTTPNGNYIHPEDYEMIFDRVFSGDDEYLTQLAYYGNFLQDEPLTGNDNAALQRLLTALTIYYRHCEQLGIVSEPVINLLPGGYTDDYISYLDFYFANIAPMVGYVSFDQYVLDQSGSTYSIREDHLANLEMMAQRILASNYRIQLRTYIFPHAIAEGSHRAITMADELRFQIYTNLIYGASEIIYYGYTCHTNENRDITIGLVNMYTKEKSQVYYFAQEVNNEVLSFGSYYRHFDYQGTIAKDTGSIFNKNKQMKKLQYAISSHKGLTSYSVNRNTLIGCFEDNNEQSAYVVMYYADPKTTNNTDTVTLKFNGYNGVIVFQNGQKHAYRLTNNSYELTLNPGCGAFVIPVNLQ